MVIKKDSNQLWTFIGIAVVVAVIASVLTVTVTGNVIKQNNNLYGKYKVYTIDEIDKKLNSLSENVGGVYSHCYEKTASTKGWGEIGLYTYDNNTFVNSVNVACGINEKVLPKSATCNPKTWKQKTPVYLSSIAQFDKSEVLGSREGEGLTLICIGGESQGILSAVCCSATSPSSGGGGGGGSTEPKVQACTSNIDCPSGSLCNVQTKTCYSTNAGGGSGGSGPKAFNLQNGEATTTVLGKDSYDIRVLSILSSTSTNVCVKINTGNEKCYRNLNTGESMALDNGAKLNVVNIVYSARVGAVNYVQLSLQGPK